jgi:hypothetical protein
MKIKIPYYELPIIIKTLLFDNVTGKDLAKELNRIPFINDMSEMDIQLKIAYIRAVIDYN